MKLLLALSVLILMSTNAMADTVPSTFDEGCSVNWNNGGCGTTPIGSGPNTNGRADGVDRTPTPPSTPAPCDKGKN